jgi:hypothetical protein
MLNCLKPRTFLVHPKGGSVSPLHLTYISLPLLPASLLCIAFVNFLSPPTTILSFQMTPKYWQDLMAGKFDTQEEVIKQKKQGWGKRGAGSAWSQTQAD